MERSRVVKIVFSLVLVFGLFSFYVSYRIREKKVMEEPSVMGEIDVPEGIPYILSLPPISVTEGEKYEYIVQVADIDTENEYIYLEYVVGPYWLEVDGLVLSGEAPLGSAGTYEFVLRVSDGYNSSIQEGYILVESVDE